MGQAIDFCQVLPFCQFSVPFGQEHLTNRKIAQIKRNDKLSSIWKMTSEVWQAPGLPIPIPRSAKKPGVCRSENEEEGEQEEGD